MSDRKALTQSIHPTKLFLTWYVDSSVSILHKRFQDLMMFCFRYVKVLNVSRNSSRYFRKAVKTYKIEPVESFFAL